MWQPEDSALSGQAGPTLHVQQLCYAPARTCEDVGRVQLLKALDRMAPQERAVLPVRIVLVRAAPVPLHRAELRRHPRCTPTRASDLRGTPLETLEYLDLGQGFNLNPVTTGYEYLRYDCTVCS